MSFKASFLNKNLAMLCLNVPWYAGALSPTGHTIMEDMATLTFHSRTFGAQSSFSVAAASAGHFQQSLGIAGREAVP